MANSRQRDVFLNFLMRFSASWCHSVFGRCIRRRCRRGGRRGWWRGVGRVDPAGLHSSVEAIGRLRIDAAAVQDQTAEGRLDMSARAAEPIVKVEVPKGGVEVVAPQKSDDPPAQPNTFWIARRPGDFLLCLGELVDLLRFLGGFLADRLFRRLGIFRRGRGYETEHGRGDDERGE